MLQPLGVEPTGRGQARREPQRGPGKHYRGALSPPRLCMSKDRNAKGVTREETWGEVSPHHPTRGVWGAS